jgi:hypothetical protein
MRQPPAACLPPSTVAPRLQLKPRSLAVPRRLRDNASSPGLPSPQPKPDIKPTDIGWPKLPGILQMM